MVDLSLLVQMLLGGVLGLSVYLPLMAGQLSLASPAFYAIGGYVAALLSTSGLLPASGPEYPLPWLLLEMLVAAVLAALIAWIVGRPVLRLQGIYLAIATIALVEILRVLCLNLDWTGGAVGIFGIPQPFLDRNLYLTLVLPLLGLALALLLRLEHSRTGRALAAIRDDELAASAMGIDPTRHKLLVFILSAVLAALVGVVYAHFLNTWNARQGTFDACITFLAFVIFGGSRTAWGPVLGGVLLTALPELLRPIGDVRLVIFGAVIVLGSLFYPQGLVTPHLLTRLRRSLAWTE
jgi:branched-chain amino acid transport system permease protein